MNKETIRIIDAAEALINRLHNESVFNPNITECNELYLALFAVGRCVESASPIISAADKRKNCEFCKGRGEIPAPDGWAICPCSR